MIEKDLSLLRPLDLETAQGGARVAWYYNGDEGVLCGGPDHRGTICINWESHAEAGRGLRLYGVSDKSLRLAPLCWVEGRPVYKGDVLYKPSIKGRLIASHVELSWGEKYLCFNDNNGSEYADNRRSNMTWTAPNPVLCEVEGKPVRKGDRLYWITQKRWIVAKTFDTRTRPGIQADCDDTSEFAYLDRLSWAEPEQPLFMLDGKPVMKGQRLWGSQADSGITPTGWTMARFKM